MPFIYDICHGYIPYNDTETRFLDNHWVKRLKRIKQLGLLEHVFPSASHSRFEHSLGVSHIAENYVETLLKNSPKIESYKKEYKFCIKMAGLFHDLGHGPFSHVFDGEFMKRRCPDLKFTHEQMSLKMLDYMIDDNNIDIEQDHVQFVKDLIMASEHAKSSKGKTREREFL